jgi:hypothetical protein
MCNQLKALYAASLPSRELTSDAAEHRLSVCAPGGHSVRCHNFGGIHFVVVQRYNSAEGTGQEARVPRKLGLTPSCLLVGPSGSLLIFAHRRIDLFAPGVETTFEIE